MTDRDRLIELIVQAKEKFNNLLFEKELIADYLLANGVIVPPCKVGKTVYVIGVFTGQIVETKVESIHYNKSGIYLCLENFTTASVDQQLGKTVFLTKEEAEEKLKELGKDD